MIKISLFYPTVSPQSSKSEYGRQKRLQSPDEAIGGTISDSNSGEDNMDRLKVELKMARAQITRNALSGKLLILIIMIPLFL